MDDVNKEKHISYEKERYCRKRLLYLLRYGAFKEGLPVSKRGKFIFFGLLQISLSNPKIKIEKAKKSIAQ